MVQLALQTTKVLAGLRGLAKSGTNERRQTERLKMLRSYKKKNDVLLKFAVGFSGQAVLIERSEEGYFPEELLVMPDVEKASAVHCRRTTVTLRNVSNHSVTLKRGMQIAHLHRVDVINAVNEKK